MEEKIKKRISLVLTVILLLAVLAGCGQTEAEETTSSQPEVGYPQDGYAEGRIGDAMHSYFFDYTVNSAYLCDEFSGYTPSAEGYRLLVAEVTVKNTNRESIVMYDTDFQVQWGDDSEDAYDFPITLYVDQVSDEQLPAEYELAVDEERTGLLVYEVPEGNSDFSISYLEMFDDGTEEGETGDTFFVFFTADEQV